MARYNKNRYGSIVLNDEQGNSFTITKKEQKELKTLVKRANQRRYDKVDKYYNMVSKQNNMKGISKEAYRNILEKKGFITEKYSSAFKQFTSKADFKDYIKELKQVTKRGYGNKRIEEIRKSMIERVNKNYNSLGESIIEKLNSINDSQLLSVYVHNDDLIQEIYGSTISSDDVENLATKTLSDINRALK